MKQEEENSASALDAMEEEDDAQAFANTCARLKWQIAMFSDRAGDDDSIAIGYNDRIARHLLLHAGDVDMPNVTRLAQGIAESETYTTQKDALFELAQAKRSDIIAKKAADIAINDAEYADLDRLDRDYEEFPRPPSENCSAQFTFKQILAVIKICVDGWSSSSSMNHDGKEPPPLSEREAWWMADIIERPAKPDCGIIQWQGEVGRFIAHWANGREDRFTDVLPAYDWEGMLCISMKLLNFARLCVLYNDIWRGFVALDMYMTRGDDEK